jgi:hypothetical protein
MFIWISIFTISLFIRVTIDYDYTTIQFPQSFIFLLKSSMTVENKNSNRV